MIENYLLYVLSEGSEELRGGVAFFSQGLSNLRETGDEARGCRHANQFFFFSSVKILYI